MSNIISKIRQRIALKDKNKFDLSCDHITTSDFFHINPVYIKEMVPGENIKINVQTFTRLAPLVRPMYGRCQIVNRAFFVPMRTIMKGWNEFITDVPKDGVFPVVPKIRLNDLAVQLREVFATVVSGTSFDFQVINDNPQPTKYKFTPQGRRVWSLLQSLGYRFPIGYYSANGPSQESESPSALPLIAFAKIYYDWYKSQAYAADDWFNGLFDLSTSLAPTLTGEQLGALLSVCSRAVYDKDYFTSAWDRPVAPNNGLNSNYTINDVTNDSTSTSGGVITKSLVRGGTASTSNPSTPSIVGRQAGGTVANTVGNITQYTIDALKSLTDYLKRHQLAGGLAMDRMMARFGVKPSDAALNRSVYIGKDAVDVQIADVMATAAGENSNTQGDNTTLGQYAGKGVGYSPNGWFKYDTDEYGYLIIVSTLIPKVGYVQGMNRMVLHRDRLDFFTPEFDSLGVQAIARKELLSDYNLAEEQLNTNGGLASLEGVFGYTSRYAEYKTAKDNLTGQFTVPSINSGMQTWHLNRMFNAQQVQLSDLTHDQNFVVATDAKTYDRVFAITDENKQEYDHFINIYHFEVEDYAPMSQLFDDYEFDGGKKEVSIEVNGTQLN